ncbi:MAG: Fic family protein [Verrucomicrobiota bacterium JB023]|nr:Fic family protein [Verrucomicrobiota bacterium JB023]
MEFKHPSYEAILAIHEQVLAAHGGGQGIRSKELLESALSGPQASFGREPIMKDGIEVAAAYLFYLCRNQPFVDGNKRVGLATCLVFLGLNHLSEFESLDVDSWEALTLDVASLKLDRDQTTERLRELIEKS